MNIAPPLQTLSAHWAPWDDELSELTQYHLMVSNRSLYREILETIEDDSINLIDDGAVAEVFRHQAFITVYFVDMPGFVDTMGNLHRGYMQLPADYLELQQRFHVNREYTARLMEWVASRDPAMAGPFDLLLRPADLMPEHPPS